MARSIQSSALSVASLRADGTRITRRYGNANPEISDDQARLIQDTINDLDGTNPVSLRFTQVEDIDTEA